MIRGAGILGRLAFPSPTQSDVTETRECAQSPKRRRENTDLRRRHNLILAAVGPAWRTYPQGLWLVLLRAVLCLQFREDGEWTVPPVAIRPLFPFRPAEGRTFLPRIGIEPGGQMLVDDAADRNGAFLNRLAIGGCQQDELTRVRLWKLVRRPEIDFKRLGNAPGHGLETDDAALHHFGLHRARDQKVPAGHRFDDVSRFQPLARNDLERCGQGRAFLGRRCPPNLQALLGNRVGVVGPVDR
jgi:hypothetical protein